MDEHGAARAGSGYELGGATIEEIARAAPDVFWFQIYRCGSGEHATAFDLLRRAQGAGAHVAVMTLDVPVRTPGPRELAVGIGREDAFRINWRMLRDVALSPRWAWAALRSGPPRFANFKAYVGEKANLNDLFRFAHRETGGPFCWGDIARYRDCWKGAAVAKGILHPADAEKRCRSASTGSSSPTMAAARMRGCRRRSIACRPLLRPSATR